jgi:hypothetical protein
LFIPGAIYHVYCRVARGEFVFSDFVARFESASGHALNDLASRYRSERHIRARVEFSVIAVSRYGFRGCDIAALLGKGGNSVTRWLNRGLAWERDDPAFSDRLGHLDAAISRTP